MTMITQGTLPPAAAILDDIAKQCNDEVNNDEAKQVQNKKKKRSCQKLGQDKHKCCERKIQEHRNKNPKDGDPPIEGERCYNRPPKPDANGDIGPVDTTPLNTDRAATIKSAIASCGKNPSRKAVSRAIGKALNGKVFPDAAILGPGNPPSKTFVDFKFACPASNRKKSKKAKKSYRSPKQSRAQEQAHNALGQATGGGKTITIRF
jgi:hypothetical protein